MSHNIFSFLNEEKILSLPLEKKKEVGAAKWAKTLLANANATSHMSYLNATNSK